MPDSPFLIQILLDQASPDAFFSLVDEGYTPNISKYILGKRKGDVYENATISRKIVTGYPSNSVNSHTSILTGAYADKTMIPYAWFWDLMGSNPNFVDIEKVAPFAFRKLNVKYLNSECKTLFEHAHPSASFHHIRRGADYKYLTIWKILRNMLPTILKVRKECNENNENAAFDLDVWKNGFRNSMAAHLKRMEKGVVPKVTFIIFLPSDYNAHRRGFDSIGYKDAIQLFDHFVECIVDGFDKNGNHIKGLSELGLLDSVIWCICSDHAGRPVYRDKSVVIDSLLRLESGLNLIVGEDKGHKKAIKKLRGDYSIVDAFAQFSWFIGNFWFGTDSLESFSRFYPEEFFRNYVTKSGSKINLIRYFAEKHYIQFVIIPQGFDNIMIASKSGVGKVSRIFRDGEPHYAWVVNQGCDDPLNYATLDHNKFYHHKEWLDATIEHELPDVFHRLFGFFGCACYTPNFVITADFNYHFVPTSKIYDKGDNAFLEIQNHDGLYREESVVPLVLSGCNIDKGKDLGAGRTIDILPLLLNLI